MGMIQCKREMGGGKEDYKGINLVLRGCTDSFPSGYLQCYFIPQEML